MTPLHRFVQLVKLERADIGNIYFYAAFSGLIYLSLPLGIQAIVNLLFGGLVSTSIVVLIALVVSGVLLHGWMQLLQMRIIERIQRRVFTRYAMQFAQKIPRLDMLAIDDYYLPELVNRFFDTASLQKGISKVLLELPTASIQILFGLILLSFYHPSFIVFGLSLVLLITLILRFTYPTGIHTSLQESNFKYEVGYWLEEMACTVKSLKFMGKTSYPVHKTDTLVCNYLDARASHFRVLQIQFGAFIVFRFLVTAALLILGTVLVLQQQLNLGQFIAAEIVILILLNSVEKVIGSMDVLYDMLTALDKVNILLDKPEEPSGGLKQPAQNPAVGIAIRAQNLSYRYHDQSNEVLHNLSFDIQPGEKICLLGSRGSGKTTLLNLMTGAYNNFSGQLLFDGYPLGGFDLNNLRQSVGVYLATADLFSGTLFENLTIGDDRLNEQQVMQMAEKTGLMSFIQSQKEGLFMPVDSMGRKLPRTVANKILLTRALLTQPRLLLLEDCWSIMESAEQETIIRNLTDRSNTFTLLAVTNDESFAQRCDKVMLLNHGRLAAFGPPAEVKRTAEYQTLFKQLSL